MFVISLMYLIDASSNVKQPLMSIQTKLILTEGIIDDVNLRDLSLSINLEKRREVTGQIYFLYRQICFSHH